MPSPVSEDILRISAFGLIDPMTSLVISICSGVAASTLLMKHRSASLICVSTSLRTAFISISMRVESTSVMTGACSIWTSVLASEYSAALFRPHGIATPEGSTITMSGSNESWSFARVSANVPAI